MRTRARDVCVVDWHRLSDSDRFQYQSIGLGLGRAQKTDQCMRDRHLLGWIICILCCYKRMKPVSQSSSKGFPSVLGPTLLQPIPAVVPQNCSAGWRFLVVKRGHCVDPGAVGGWIPLTGWWKIVEWLHGTRIYLIKPGHLRACSIDGMDIFRCRFGIAWCCFALRHLFLIWFARFYILYISEGHFVPLYSR